LGVIFLHEGGQGGILKLKKIMEGMGDFPKPLLLTEQPHPLNPPLLQKERGRGRKRGFAPLKFPFYNLNCL
jgi:hypothetical protein